MDACRQSWLLTGLLEQFILKSSIADYLEQNDVVDQYSSESRLNDFKISAAKVSRLFSDHKRARRMSKAVVHGEISTLQLEVAKLREQISQSQAEVPKEVAMATEVPAKPEAPKTNTAAAGKAKKGAQKLASQKRNERKAKGAAEAADSADIMDGTNIFAQ